jgi:beta-galactosidase/beta-glucuronidase
MTSATNTRKEYPRPQFVREDWLNLNGEWNFKFDDDNVGEQEKWYKQSSLDKQILVPFTYETKASGIGEEVFHPYVWYQRLFTIPDQHKDQKVIIHFQASDYITKVWVNGELVGKNKGGYVAFSFDITNFIDSARENNLVVKVEDSNSCHQPRGKQRWIDENFGCWYVQTTGIWQTVWLEFLNEHHIHNVKMTPDIDTSSVEFEYNVAGNLGGQKDLRLRLATTIIFNGKMVKEVSQIVDRSRFTVNVDVTSDIHEWKVMLWSPKNPNLYDVQFTLYKGEQVLDQVDAYFGMRKVSIENGNVLLNNVPVYQKLILDQGYWKDTHLTPPSDEAILEDIDKVLEMGYNGVRKHQKVEDQRFLYWCDKKGLLVWSEVAATYEYSDEAVENFTEEWIEIVKQNYNHPSIITWVPFNESWGVKNIFTDQKQQQFTEAIYYLTKSIDNMRPVVVNDGWEHTISDILTLHDYVMFGEEFIERYKNKDKIVSNEIAHNKHKYAMAKGYEYKGQPILISEYGGIAFEADKGWGYGEHVKTEEDFLNRYKSITQAIKETDYICGFCYTQITDVQQEINGLLTEDRQPKVDLNKIKEINNL